MYPLKRQQKHELFAENSTEKVRYQQETRIANTMIMITITFLVSWAPIILSYIAQVVTGDVGILKVYFKLKYGKRAGLYIGTMVRSATISLTVLNSLMDPLIYAFRMKDVREAIKSLFKRKRNDDPGLSLSAEISLENLS